MFDVELFNKLVYCIFISFLSLFTNFQENACASLMIFLPGEGDGTGEWGVGRAILVKFESFFQASVESPEII